MREGWKTIPFEKSIQKVKYTTKIPSSEYLPKGAYPVVSQEEGLISGYWSNEADVFRHSKPVVIFGDHTRIIKYVNFDFVLGADGVKILLPVDGLSAKFLAYYLRWYNVPSLGYSRHFKLLKEVSVPVPSIQEQEKIVAELDCLTGIIEKKRQQQEELDKLAQAIFYAMFGDPITNEKGWEVKKMGSFSSCLAGATPSTTHEEYWENGTIPWLSSGEVGRGRIYDTEKKITQAGYENCSTRLVPAHTLVIAMAGQGKTRGTAGVAEIPLCTNQSICSIIPNEKVALVDFLYYQMQQRYKDLRSISNGDGGRGGLNLKLIGNYPVIVPPLALQNQFAQKIEAIERQKDLVKRSIVETETLFNSRMDYWFN